jgi:hypothetical protein
VTKVDQLREHLKDIAEEEILDMIDDIEDLREMDDSPQGLFQGATVHKEAAWPHAEYEVVSVFGRTTTLSVLLQAAKTLGRPFAMPPPPVRVRMKPKVWGIPPPRKTKANVAREHKRALAKLRNLVVNESDEDSDTEESEESEEESLPSDDEGTAVAKEFDELQYPPQSLAKANKYHLPVLQISAMNM